MKFKAATPLPPDLTEEVMLEVVAWYNVMAARLNKIIDRHQGDHDAMAEKLAESHIGLIGATAQILAMADCDPEAAAKSLKEAMKDVPKMLAPLMPAGEKPH